MVFHVLAVPQFEAAGLSRGLLWGVRLARINRRGLEFEALTSVAIVFQVHFSGSYSIRIEMQKGDK